MIADLFDHVGSIRRPRFAFMLVVAISPLWFAGCASEYVQLANSAQRDLNNGVQLIREKNAPMTKAVGLPPMTLSTLSTQTLRDADKYFDQAQNASNAAAKNFEDAYAKAEKQCGQEEDCEMGSDLDYKIQLEGPGDTAWFLSAWVQAVVEMREAEQLRVAGKEADALKKAYDAYEGTDPTSTVPYLADSLQDDAKYHHPDQSTSKENRARMENESKRALMELHKALKLGFHDWRGLAINPDFKALRKLPEFQRLVAHYRRAGNTH